MERAASGKSLRATAAGEDARAALDRVADVLLDRAQLPLARHRTDVRALVRADRLAERLHLLDDARREIFGDAFVHVAALDRCARLA